MKCDDFENIECTDLNLLKQKSSTSQSYLLSIHDSWSMTRRPLSVHHKWFIRRVCSLSIISMTLHDLHCKSPANLFVKAKTMETSSSALLARGEGYPSITDGFSSQRGSNVKGVSMSCRYHVMNTSLISVMWGQKPRNSISTSHTNGRNYVNIEMPSKPVT